MKIMFMTNSNIKLLFLLTLIIGISACSENPDDFASTKIPDTKLNFGHYSDNETITFKEDEWSIKAFVSTEDNEIIQEVNSSNGTDKTVYTYKWISVQKLCLNSLDVKVNKNTTLNDRSIKIQLSVGNENSFVTITQSDEMMDGRWPDMIKLSKDILNFSMSAGSETITTLGDFVIFAFVDSENYSHIQDARNSSDDDKTVFTYDWISVQKLGKAIKVMVTENTTNNDRRIKIKLNQGNYFGYVTVIQSKE